MDTPYMQLSTAWLISMGATIGKAGAKIALIIALGLVAMRFLRLGIQHLESLVARTGMPADVDSDTSRKRAATLTGILRTIVISLIWAVIIVEVVDQIGEGIDSYDAGLCELALGAPRTRIGMISPTIIFTDLLRSLRQYRKHHVCEQD